MNGRAIRGPLTKRAMEGVLVDIGTSCLTGLRRSVLGALPGLAPFNAHPVFGTLPLCAEDSRRLGSDFVRMGLVFDPPEVDEDRFRDIYGVEWLLVDGAPAPLNHPLEKAPVSAIRRYPHPRFSAALQVPEASGGGSMIVMDAPCPGLLDLTLGLRNAWQFFDDVSSRSRAVEALLDWSMETIFAAYDHALSQAPVRPEIVVYGDDLGFSGGMFLSVGEFRALIKPRMKAILDHIRAATGARLCLHSCGAIRPLIGDLAELGLDLLNLDPKAKGMAMDAVRDELPAGLILHGSSDLVALGGAVMARDLAATAALATDFALTTPLIAAPTDCVTSHDALLRARRGAAFLRALGSDGLSMLARLGPVRSALERAIAESESRGPDLALTGAHPNVVQPERIRRKALAKSGV
jgi:hypothetical protein